MAFAYAMAPAGSFALKGVSWPSFKSVRKFSLSSADEIVGESKSVPHFDGRSTSDQMLYEVIADDDMPVGSIWEKRPLWDHWLT